MAITAEEQYYRTEVAYKNFLKDPEKLKYRENWLVYIDEFRAAYRLDPSGTLAAAALYMSGELYKELYKRSFKSSDKKQAIDLFQRLLKRFPTSNYRRKAESALKAFSKTRGAKSSVKKEAVKKSSSEKARVIKTKVRKEVFRRSKQAYKANRMKKSWQEKSWQERKTRLVEKSQPKYKPPIISPYINADTTIMNLRFWSNPNYTRIVVDANQDTSYTYRLLKKDSSANKPHRLYVDFDNSQLGKNIKKIIPINDDLLIDARASQYQTDSVRVVVDIKSFGTYKIFSLRNPFRTIIDVWGGDNNYRYASVPFQNRKFDVKKPEHKKTKSKSLKTEKNEGDVLKIKPSDIAKSLALGVRRIVIDPGHGGKDAGAVGYNKRILEKNIVLSIGKRLARKIRRNLGCEVIMTRSTDRFLSLEERTAIANTKNADLFISIHTNAHPKRSAYGIETYFLNLATDDEAIRVAARENATSRKNISDLQTILQDLMQNAKINESSRLAAHIQKSLYRQMKKKYSKIKNKGVKQAPFYVLLGAQMPSVLVETSFISNKRECQRLTNATYQERLCDAIVNGIRKYIKEMNPTALLRLHPGGSG
ncbi:N-acetylmuramoyl-L-alanine amidase [Desulfonema magnum]|uniref:N-acetylmuramoyl-L-alanine amidase n=1 Tax=Desulfonema magnum TaxID=45655 RepID=UPI001FE982EC|nr:N-acetylmuramoyl-L-alanine amidase [Desulfonema magnum]